MNHTNKHFSHALPTQVLDFISNLYACGLNTNNKHSLLCVQWFDKASYEQSFKQPKIVKTDIITLKNMPKEEVYNIYKEYTKNLPNAIYEQFDIVCTSAADKFSQHLIAISKNNTPKPMDDTSIRLALYAHQSLNI